MSEIIKIQELSKVYKGNNFPSLNNLSLNISEGITGILGPNGAGKTTLIHIITGLIKDFNGSVECFEYKLPNKIDKLKPLIGIVPQEIALYQDLTAVENLKFFGSLYKIDKKLISQNIDSYLTDLGLYDRRNDKIKNFSGGMKRRVNLICGLLHQPKLLLLDEPTVGVDVQSKKVILEFLKELNKKGTNIIYTSHLMEDVQLLCDTVNIIDNGELIESDKTDKLITKYENCNNLEDVFVHLTGKALRD